MHNGSQASVVISSTEVTDKTEAVVLRWLNDKLVVSKVVITIYRKNIFVLSSLSKELQSQVGPHPQAGLKTSKDWISGSVMKKKRQSVMKV